MEQLSDNTSDLFRLLGHKSQLKQDIYQKTLQVFRTFAESANNLSLLFKSHNLELAEKVTFKYEARGDFGFELHFGGDILIFMMHTNVFEFSRNHEVMKMPYIQADKERSYCGLINIYNFLADSFKYNRVNDSGYLIGRIFINKDLNYFIEGKRELGLLYTNFGSSVLNESAIQQIIQSAMLYTLRFDLLTPPFDAVKEIQVNDLLATFSSIQLATAKRMGYKFMEDHDEG